MTAMVAVQLANAAASGEVELGEIGRETAASLFINLVRGEPQLQCLTHPDAAPSSAWIDQWANAAVVTFMRAYGCGEASPKKRSRSGRKMGHHVRNNQTTPFGSWSVLRTSSGLAQT